MTGITKKGSLKMRGVVSTIVFLALVFSVLHVFAQQERPPDKEKPMNDLRIAPGKRMAEGSNKIPVGPHKLLTYKLEEVPLSEPRELEIRGKKERIESVFRLTITGGESLATAGMIWIDDAALPGVWSHGPQKIGALIADRSILREGAEISISNRDGTQLYSLPERLTLPASLKATISPPVEEGNTIVGIHSALRIVGSSRQPIIQIEMRTERPFPVRNAALQLQIGKQFFLNELGGDPSGHGLTVSLTPKAFAELKDGAEVIAFYNSPDRSGAFAKEIWYFGRLNKSMLDR
jgi:hypothetical protein